MDSKITYHQQVSYCGKPRCRRCREGTGHGPYWYSYQTVNGRTVRTYVGKQLPVGLQDAGVGDDSSVSSVSEVAGAVVRLYVLGQFTLERHNGQRWQAVTDASMQHQRVRSLLTCLISSPGRKIGREQAIELLWPDLDFDTASHRLDKAVHSLRQLFEPARSRPATSELLLTEHATLQLADQSRVWVDADAFDALLARARSSNDPGQSEQLLEEAMLLYAGDYLPEERQTDWTQTRRESLQRGWVGLLLELADLRIAREAISSAIDTLDRLLAIDPTNEAAVQRLILLMAQSGRRGEAMRIYQRFAAVLKQEYKMTPLPETRNLYEAAQRGNPASLSLTASPPSHIAHVVSPESEARPAIQVGRNNQSRLVGRDQELLTLRQVLLDTEQSRRVKLAGQKKTAVPLESMHRVQCVLLMGDVGIGKTRLAEEMAREATRRGWTVAWTRAYTQETSIPYRMWTETLRKAMARGLWQRQEIARHPLIYQSLRDLLPELEDLLPAPDPSAISPEQEQMRLWEAARSLLATISESAPLLIVLDDLQWADNSSCELLAYLVRQLRHQPVLIAGTCRDIELAPDHPLRSVLNDLQREQAIQSIDVQPLTDEQIRVLVSGLPEPVVQRIQARAAGNPFFAEELARNVGAALETQSTVSNSHGTINAPDLPNTLPDTIAAVLDLRLGRISSDCLRLLVRAAVLGGSFEFSALRALENGPKSSDEDTLLDLLEEALQTGMLSEEGSGTRITYHFWHPLLVSHLYDGLSAGRRASLHRRAAEALIRIHGDREQEQAAAISYHLVNGGAPSASIAHYAELAGDRAYALSAYPEAVRHYRLALEHLGSLPASAPAEEHLRLANLLERLGECTRVQGNDTEARNYFERVLESRKQYSLTALQLDVAYEAQIDALLWIEIGKTWFDTGDYEHAEQSFNRAEQVLHDADVATGPVWASLGLERSYILWRKGNFEKARETAHHTLNIFDAILRQHINSIEIIHHSTATRRTLAGDPADLGRTHLLLGNIAIVEGESINALHHLDAALTIFEQHDRQKEIANVCCNLGDFYLRKAEYTLAQSILRRSSAIADSIGHVPIMSVALGNLGMLYARLGDLVEAESYFKRGFALAEQLNDPVNISLLQGFLSSVMLDQGKLGEAVSLLYQALNVGYTMKFPPAIGVALVAKGNLRLAQSLISQESIHHSTETKKQGKTLSSICFLKRANTSLRHALSLEGLEAETRTEGQLLLAQVTFLLGDIDASLLQTRQMMEEAQRYEQTWLFACAQRLMGSIMAAQGQHEQAIREFTQSLEILQKCGMRLEWGRTMRSYGEAMLQHSTSNENSHQQWVRHLQEARRAFQECNAVLDLQLVDRMLAAYTLALQASPHKNARLDR
ncbi:MAG TPA: DUF6788 family protein [Ktedonobacteraceae bacterium]|nr:DUF6788 family protein [Ktedonobacteraceae bacterium]